MPKVTATYWKHDENQNEGHDATMTVYEFLVDYVTDDLQISENVISSNLYAYICVPYM